MRLSSPPSPPSPPRPAPLVLRLSVIAVCVQTHRTGRIDAYYQYMLKPYDVAAGIVILEEAGGRVTTADGAAYSVFDRSLLATNDALYEQVCAVVVVGGGGLRGCRT
jgi:myo-inositol-1(or 4)-monophosphatase